MENPEFKWSQSSLKTIGESGFQGLPRAQISTDRLSVESGDSAGQVSTTRSLDPLFLSSSVSAETLHGVKRYRRMRSREMESGTPSNQKVPARGSRGEENYGSLGDGDGDSTIGLTIL
ncbi:unnamed protein product [Lymnaea stagnalis]|uniref:Uncharacterized protein n=1 Tax=Lymnaea stagnalis TaxID=6523 RepID=A0AAV2I0M5_LYMST